MARSSTKAGASADTVPAAAATPAAPAAPAAKPKAKSQPKPKATVHSVDEPSLSELAAGLLARTIRPRVGYVRRLAQAVLESEEKRAKRKAKDLGKKKGGGKKRKLAKIPRQKKRG